MQRMILIAALLAPMAAEPVDDKPEPWDVPDHTMQRAGFPQHIACYAQPSETTSYMGYYVGGGSPCGGRYPAPDEGTWGWDYRGCVLQRHIFLGWWHRSQGGVGSYRTDGPHMFRTCRSE